MSGSDAAALSRDLAAYDRGGGAAVKADLERLAARYPSNYPANEAAGLLAIDGQDFAHALPFLERAAAANPNEAAAAANLGTAYLVTGDADAAVRVLRRAATLDPMNGRTLSSLGHALFVAKQPAEAAEAFRRAVALDPGNTDDAYNLAVALYGASKDAEATGVLGHIPAAQRNEAIEALWGDAEERQGHFKEAVEHLQAAARLAPNEANTYALAIELLRHWSWAPRDGDHGIRRAAVP